MKRGRNIKVRMTDEEYQSIIARAGRVGGVASFIRNRLFKGKLAETRDKERPRLLLLARIHANLAVMARATAERTPIEQVELVAHLVALEREIMNAGIGET